LTIIDHVIWKIKSEGQKEVQVLARRGQVLK